MNNECTKCNKPVTVEPVQDQPVDNLESLPDNILAERIITSQETGQKLSVMVRVPSERLFGHGTADNQTTLTPNNEITVPEGMPLAARIVNNGNYNTVELTTATSKPDFLVVSNLVDDIVIQSTGFIYYPNGHQLVVGADYYSSENGLPTTDSSSGHKIFKPISDTKLVITLGQ